MKKLMIGIMLVLIVIGIKLLLFQTNDIKKMANNILLSCQKAGYRPTCYEQEIPKLLGKLTMEQVFAVTKLVQDADPTYLYCHVLAHKISYAEAKRYPGEWKSILSRCPLAQCNYGCLHGSLIEHFRGETLNEAQIQEVIPDLSDICEPRPGFTPTDIDRTMCYHALGHLAMYITGGKPDKSILLCQNVSKKSDGRDNTDVCVQGSFMTVFQGVDPEDISLVKAIKPEKQNVSNFCAQYTHDWQSCRRESYPLFVDEIRSPAGFVHFCSYATDTAHWENCALGALNIVADGLFDKEDGVTQTTTYCNGVSLDKRGMCFAGIAQRLVQIDPLRHIQTAVSLCTLAQQQGIEKNCYDGLVGYGNVSFQHGSDDQKKYCDTLPSSWQTVCLTKN